MNKGIFITGTDTGVGKTFVAAGLIRAIREGGISVCPMKPAESGCRKRMGDLVPLDAVTLMRAAGIEEHLDAINPYRLRQPLAPSVAAEIERVRISPKRIVSAYRKLEKKYDMTIVEGAGGIMVPLSGKYLFLDLAVDLGLPVLIVSRPSLGTINHTLLTINALRERGLDFLGVVINYADGQRRALAERTSPLIIEELGSVPILGTVPYSEDLKSPRLKKVFIKMAGEML